MQANTFNEVTYSTETISITFDSQMHAGYLSYKSIQFYEKSLFDLFKDYLNNSVIENMQENTKTGKNFGEAYQFVFDDKNNIATHNAMLWGIKDVYKSFFYETKLDLPKEYLSLPGVKKSIEDSKVMDGNSLKLGRQGIGKISEDILKKMRAYVPGLDKINQLLLEVQNLSGQKIDEQIANSISEKLNKASDIATELEKSPFYGKKEEIKQALDKIAHSYGDIFQKTDDLSGAINFNFNKTYPHLNDNTLKLAEMLMGKDKEFYIEKLACDEKAADKAKNQLILLLLADNEIQDAQKICRQNLNCLKGNTIGIATEQSWSEILGLDNDIEFVTFAKLQQLNTAPNKTEDPLFQKIKKGKIYLYEALVLKPELFNQINLDQFQLYATQAETIAKLQQLNTAPNKTEDPLFQKIKEEKLTLDEPLDLNLQLTFSSVKIDSNDNQINLDQLQSYATQAETFKNDWLKKIALETQLELENDSTIEGKTPENESNKLSY